MEDKITYVLIRFQDNWADEIDVDVFCIKPLTKEEYADFLKAIGFITLYKGDISSCVGSNECIEYKSGEEFLSAFDIQIISKEDYETLERLGFTGDSHLFNRLCNVYYDNVDE